MPRDIKLYDLLISCPGDVEEECGIIKKVVETFNRAFGDGNNIRINPKHWSKDSFPQSGGAAQELLNKQFVENCDITVAVFWTRFGTPTDEFESGTEEEIELMLDQGKQVFLYFSDKPAPPSGIDQDQYEKVKDFKNHYKGIYSGFSDLFEFEQSLLNHLTLYFLRTIEENDFEIGKKNVPKLVVSGIGSNSTTEVLFAKSKDYFDTPFFDTLRQTIKELYGSINNIILPDDFYEDKDEREKVGFGINWGGSSLYDDKGMQPVEFPDKKIEIIKNYAYTQKLDMNEDFFYFADLKKPIIAAVRSFIQPVSLIQGIDEAKEKYKIIEELFYKILEYNEWEEYFLEFQKYHSILGVVSNVGRKFDEDIDVKLIIPKGYILWLKDFPIPGGAIIDKYNHNCLEEQIFKCEKKVFFENYSGYPVKTKLRNHEAMQFLEYNKTADEKYSSQKDIYKSRLQNIYCYEMFNDQEYDVLVFNIAYLKQNTNMIFPSKLFLNEIPIEISYEIRSKHYPDVISGCIEVK